MVLCFWFPSVSRGLSEVASWRCGGEVAALAAGSFVLVAFVCDVTVRDFIALFYPQRTMRKG